MMERRHGEAAAAIAHATVVHLEHGKAMMGEHLVERVDGARGVTHGLALRAAVWVEDQGNAAVDGGRRAVRGQQDYTVQHLSVGGAEVHKARREGVIVVPCVRGPELAAGAGDRADLHPRGLGERAVGICKILGVRGHGDGVHAGLPGDAQGFAARQRNREKMLLAVIALVGFEVDDALSFVHSEHGVDLVLTGLELALQFGVGKGMGRVKAVAIDVGEAIAPAQPEELAGGVEKAQTLVLAAAHGIVKLDVVGIGLTQDAVRLSGAYVNEIQVLHVLRTVEHHGPGEAGTRPTKARDVEVAFQAEIDCLGRAVERGQHQLDRGIRVACIGIALLVGLGWARHPVNNGVLGDRCFIHLEVENLLGVRRPEVVRADV